MLGEIKCDEAHPDLNSVLRNNQVHCRSLDLFTDKLRHVNIFNSKSQDWNQAAPNQKWSGVCC